MHRESCWATLALFLMTSPAQKINYKTAVLATREELRLLHSHSEGVQDALSELIAGGGLNNLAYVKQLQSLDYLTQSLSALTEFWGDLAVQTPEDWGLTLSAEMAAITLKDLSDKLSGTEPSSQSVDVTEDGTCYLF